MVCLTSGGLDKRITRLKRARHLVDTGVLSAPCSFVTADLHFLKRKCNGCGVANAWFDYVPDRFIGTNVRHACFIHDWEYYLGLTLEDKKKADDNFKANLRILIELDTTNRVLIKVKYTLACVYYLGVKHFGHKSFLKGK